MPSFSRYILAGPESIGRFIIARQRSQQILQTPAVRFFRALFDMDRIVAFKPNYHHDGLASAHWLARDARFDACYDNARNQRLGVGPTAEFRWRVHVACWAARIGQNLGGAFVECGVNRGFMSRIIIDYLGTTPTFYLMDTFKGLDPRYVSDGERSKLETLQYAECYDEVVKTFADCPQVKIIRGAIPDTLPQVTEDKIAYLSIDMNNAAPEIAAINYFWPKLVRGAYVVLDDYGFAGHTEQRDAFDKWSRDNGVPLLSLPTGQGLMVKS